MKISKVAYVIFNIWVLVLFAYDIYRGNYNCAMLIFGIWAMFMLYRLAQKDAAMWEGECSKLFARHKKLLKKIDEAYLSKPRWELEGGKRMMPELERLREMDEKARQLAALYGAEKARADRAEARFKKVESALLAVLKELNSETCGSIADLVSAIETAESVIMKG